MNKEALSIEEHGNKLIMFFDGAENAVIDIMGKETPCIKWCDGYYPEWNLPKFNEDWNLLMPVVEKICRFRYHDYYGSLGKTEDDGEFDDCAYIRTFGMRDKEGNYMVRFNASQLFSASTLIEATYMAVIDFIQWYNNTQSIKK